MAESKMAESLLLREKKFISENVQDPKLYKSTKFCAFMKK